MFIDATYEGDLMAAAGVDVHASAAKPNSNYDETLNGVRESGNQTLHRFTAQGRSVREAGRPERAACCSASTPNPLPADGEGDKRLQAYCFRMCMSRRAGQPRAVREARRLRRERSTNCCSATSKRATAHSDEARPDAQRQDRHEQQLRRQHRLHRSELRLPRSELRRARKDHRRRTCRTRRG